MLKELSLLQNFIENNDTYCWLIINPDYMKVMSSDWSCKVKIKTNIDREICVKFSDFYQYTKTMWDFELSTTDKKLNIKSWKIKGSITIVNKPTYFDQPFNFSWNNVKFKSKQFIDFTKSMQKYCHNIPQYPNSLWIAYHTNDDWYMTSTDTIRLVTKNIECSWNISFIILPAIIPKITSLAEYCSFDNFDLQVNRWIYISNDKIDCHLVMNEVTLPNYFPVINWFVSVNQISINKDELVKWLSVSQIWISDDMKWTVELHMSNWIIKLMSIDTWCNSDIELSWKYQSDIKIKVSEKYLKEMCQLCSDQEITFDLDSKWIIKYSRKWLNILFWTRQ